MSQTLHIATWAFLAMDLFVVILLECDLACIAILKKLTNDGVFCVNS